MKWIKPWVNKKVANFMLLGIRTTRVMIPDSKTFLFVWKIYVE